MGFPQTRMRRLRRTEAIRRMVREHRVLPSNLIMPYFVVDGEKVREPISSMSGQDRLSVDLLVKEARRVRDLEIPAVLLFGVTEKKDCEASEACRDDGLIQRAVRALKKQVPELAVICDLCCCEYTDSGHCGILTPAGDDVDNDATLELLAKIALTYAEAGADIIAPSDMMDGRIGAIRDALDTEGFPDVAIMSYAAKYASAFYGPFREAAGSGHFHGTRKTYQMDPGNAREALREVALDLEEGADMVMVKPALAYLDVIREVSEAFAVPLAAYSVSGEYAMIKNAAQQKLVDERMIVRETLTAIKRAGADMIITYYAVEAVEKGYLKD
ncbi:MAG TPA: porphobilinogen synthase [bacterium]|nr:porphobilinogen synthase [bacterium]